MEVAGWIGHCLDADQVSEDKVESVSARSSCFDQSHLSWVSEKFFHEIDREFFVPFAQDEDDDRRSFGDQFKLDFVNVLEIDKYIMGAVHGLTDDREQV